MTRTLNTIPGSPRGLDSAHRRGAQPSPRHIRHLPRNSAGRSIAARPVRTALQSCEQGPGSRRTTMADEPGTPNAATLLRATAIFRELSNEQLAAIWSRAKIHNLRRGEVLVRQHTPSDSVYIVVSGRFEVWVEGRTGVIAEIGVGEPIGEIGFFSGAPARRRSSPRATRSCSSSIAPRSTPSRARCRRSTRRCCGRSPAGSPRPACAPCSQQRGVAARTVAVIAGGRRRRSRRPSTIASTTWSDARGKGRLLTRDYLQRHFPGRTPDDPDVSNWLNAIEHEYELIAYLADDTLTDWTRKAIRQADQVLIVVSGAVRGRQRGGSVLVHDPSAGAPPAGAPARAPRRLGQGHRGLARRTRRRDAPPRVARGRSRLQEPASLPDRARARLRRRRRRRLRARPMSASSRPSPNAA